MKKSKNIPMIKYTIKHGIFLGIAIIIFSLASYLAGSYIVQGWINLIVLLIVTVTSIMSGLLMFKKNNEGYISLGEALKIGIGITVLGGLIATLWEILFLKVIDPEIITQLEGNQIKKIAKEAKDFTLENMDRKIQLTNKIKSPIIMLVSALAEDIFIGFIFSLIGGLIMRRKRDPFR
ncbi:DUF4199 domain-containing protein [uncultured Aquimarina sp.]|uniref:DUF4199 domain-containing protein n=1 Tax=uncultured Aquimarina sp. TaxID=575652 RepID=UPI0026312496|nr:DUF4199 domain-containing protein [uncultured Aquimarina sp.]